MEAECHFRSQRDSEERASPQETRDSRKRIKELQRVLHCLNENVTCALEGALDPSVESDPAALAPAGRCDANEGLKERLFLLQKKMRVWPLGVGRQR